MANPTGWAPPRGAMTACLWSYRAQFLIRSAAAALDVGAMLLVLQPFALAGLGHFGRAARLWRRAGPADVLRQRVSRIGPVSRLLAKALGGYDQHALARDARTLQQRGAH